MAVTLARNFLEVITRFPVLTAKCCCPSTPLNISRMQFRFKGHSKWQNIKFKKAHIDFARSKEFGKLSMEIITAVRGGGIKFIEILIKLRTVIENYAD